MIYSEIENEIRSFIYSAFNKHRFDPIDAQSLAEIKNKIDNRLFDLMSKRIISSAKIIQFQFDPSNNSVEIEVDVIFIKHIESIKINLKLD